MKINQAILPLALCVLLAGCGQDQYAIEKTFFQVQKKASAIIKNPDATPDAQLNNVIASLEGFQKKHPNTPFAVEAQFSVVRLYVAKKQFDKAQEKLKFINNEFKKSEAICAEVVFVRGNVYEAQDDWASALGQYKTLIQAYPKTQRGFEAPMMIALRYKAKLQPDKMVQAFREAIAYYKGLALQYPNTVIALRSQLMVAQASAEIKEWEGAIYALNVVINNYKDKVQTDPMMLDVANIYYKQLNDKPKAVAELKLLIEQFPKSMSAKVAAKMLEKIEKESK